MGNGIANPRLTADLRAFFSLLRSTSSSRESRWGEAINHRAANAKLRQPEISFLPSEYRGRSAHPLTLTIRVRLGSFPYPFRPRSTIDPRFSARRRVPIDKKEPICAFFPIRFLPLTDTLAPTPLIKTESKSEGFGWGRANDDRLI